MCHLNPVSRRSSIASGASGDSHDSYEASKTGVSKFPSWWHSYTRIYTSMYTFLCIFYFFQDGKLCVWHTSRCFPCYCHYCLVPLLMWSMVWTDSDTVKTIHCVWMVFRSKPFYFIVLCISLLYKKLCISDKQFNNMSYNITFIFDVFMPQQRLSV